MGNKFSTKEDCLSYLEKMRWGKTVKCPYCHSERTHPSKNEQGRHYCYNCVKSFSVLVGTIFEDTRLELPVWFDIIEAMLKNKTGLSAMQIAAQFDITLKTAWLTAMKIRCAMIDENSELQGLLHLDENNFAAKKTATISDKKGNRSKLKVIEKITPLSLLGMLKHYIKTDNASSAKTSSRSYAKMEEAIEQISNNQTAHRKTKTAAKSGEAYWNDIKSGISGNYKSLSQKYLAFYLVEYEYKFNNRNKRSGLFSAFVKNAVCNHSPLPNHTSVKTKKKMAHA
jgi:transposase-like protein